MSPALISELAMSFDLTFELIITSSIQLPTVLSPTVRSFTTPSTPSVRHATRPASRRASSVSTTPVRYTTPSRVWTSTCRAFTLSLASSDSWITDVTPESACRVFLGTIEEAQPASASSPTPTSEPATTIPARFMFMRARPFLNVS